MDNQEQILRFLSETTEEEDAAGDLWTEASGLLCHFKRLHFFECLCVESLNPPSWSLIGCSGQVFPATWCQPASEAFRVSWIKPSM